MIADGFQIAVFLWRNCRIKFLLSLWNKLPVPVLIVYTLPVACAGFLIAACYGTLVRVVLLVSFQIHFGPGAEVPRSGSDIIFSGSARIRIHNTDEKNRWKCPKWFFYVQAVGDSALSTFAQHCNNIERLNLQSCKKLTDRTCQSLARHCPKLQVTSPFHSHAYPHWHLLNLQSWKGIMRL